MNGRATGLVLALLGGWLLIASIGGDLAGRIIRAAGIGGAG